MEEDAGSAAAIPEDVRCKRSDGKQWRCSARAMADKTVCEKHYYQAKKRAANSALRASLKKREPASPTNSGGGAPVKKLPLRATTSPTSGWGSSQGEEILPREHPKAAPLSPYSPRWGSSQGEENSPSPSPLLSPRKAQSGFTTPSPKRSGIQSYYSGRSSETSEAEGLTCHQCRRNDRANVVWCLSCDQKGYCDSCVAKWYADIPMEDVKKMCPACCGICSCRVCYNADVLIKTKLQEIAPIDKLRHLHSLLSLVLPMLKHIYAVQCFEMGMETRVHGSRVVIPRANMTRDEQMCCNVCKIPIFDFHRHCTNCLFDLCVTCCRELRLASAASQNGRSKVLNSGTSSLESCEKRSNSIPVSSVEYNVIDFPRLFPNWKVNSDGSIPCAGGCGSSRLILRRILKTNWTAKLVKNAEEMVSACKVSDKLSSNRCGFCTGSSTSQASGLTKSTLRPCSQRDDSNDNFLYCPAIQDFQQEGIEHFRKHWMKGEPIIVKNVFDPSSSSSWDPMSIFREIQDAEDWKKRQDDVVVKAVNYSNHSEVDVSLAQFIKGYSEVGVHENGWLEMLKLKDWPSPSALAELITCQRPEFFSNFPLVEFIHFKWGILNLAAKLPHDTLQKEAGPELLVAYGTHKEFSRGDPVTNLQINMGDLSYLLMHTASMNLIPGTSKTEHSENTFQYGTSKTEHSENTFQARDTKKSVGHAGNSNLSSNKWLRSVDLASKERNNLEECKPGSNFKDTSLRRDQTYNGFVKDTLEKKGFDSSHSGKDVMNVPENGRAGAIWDVFRREDAPKLNEYLRVHWREFTDSACQQVNPVYPIHHQAIFLNKYHRRKLKEEFGVEPWTFEQQIGEAIFIPAGCAFQTRNLLPSVQLSLRFLSPESLGESARIAREVRGIPNNHEAKLKMLEVGKMSLYAASSAIREIQNIILDPEVDLDVKFEDRNLTAAVYENLERFKKQRRMACA